MAVGLKLAVLIAIACLTVAGPAWNYDYIASVTGPEFWEDIFPSCGGQSQSPIDIKSSNVQFKNFTPWSFTNFDRKFGHLVIRNTGSSGKKITCEFDQLQARLLWDSAQKWFEEYEAKKPQMYLLYHVVVELPEKTMKTEGGGLDHSYWAHSFHFHWGLDKLHGTEHKINGQQYALELHIVHYSNEYNSLQHALQSGDHDALAVLGVLFKSSKQASHISDLDEITEDLIEIPGKDSQSFAEDIELDDFFPSNVNKFYRYYGSLTTPGCDEKVVWTVFSEVVSIPDDEIEPFRRRLKDGDGLTLVNNWRPVQPLNGRTVWGSHPSITSRRRDEL